ncbi:hypothetical protein NQ315_005610 [Exocentrus adspersus]|uniref:Uncharacterized protein n=1 Tax=Exocentrus adspersus TaxID=1586481 RepID=A0AAV8VV11_9CUCU|nr:hypothetical protein NQ315_005610 [Exocentrus adspersus]
MPSTKAIDTKLLPASTASLPLIVSEVAALPFRGVVVELWCSRSGEIQAIAPISTILIPIAPNYFPPALKSVK